MNTQLSVSSLPAITHNNQPVITTDLLAQLYGCKPKNISDNHINNCGRFVCGKHYFKLEKEDLISFKNKPDSVGLVGKNARHLILWTERGAARHAKMLETDQAWDVFEKLEDSYFQKRQEPTLSTRFLVSIENGRQTVMAVPEDACVMSVKGMAVKVATGEMYITSEELYSFITAAVDQLYRRNEYLMNKSV
ncbi:ORF6N domain-containing protein [Budviciaceae bacterium BWR-B9]|uniref:ORF6N domain-containing protein n=1 Tax=Limnobaculum allomyrinae TaxID=2791986 RepID=A0ABS1IT08_9GAMM|nr:MULTISPECIES: ORF6N domain-containing protein [Limnobaculum]MBK5144890.1 ORF6N domain-containing protein [Limnobaculum allomyrinae]MBV7692553.1 ORF6N domain-containing protein [Limnobaculum sp. M2-1]